MKRREFLIILVSAGAERPRTACAQQQQQVRRIGLLLPAMADDSEYPLLISAFRQRLGELGWTDRNLEIDYRWAGNNPDQIRKFALELAELAPDAIMAPGGAAAGPLLQVTRTVPVVFTIVPDPVGAGFVKSLARPGGNATGFTSFEYSIGGKWLDLLKEQAPSVTRVGIIRDPGVTAGVGQFAAIQSMSPSVGVEASPINAYDERETEQAIASFAQLGSGGLVVTASASSIRYRDLIIRTAARYNLPAVYYSREFVVRGGLLSYGPNRIERFQRAAEYVDRILKGEKPSELPVQSPTKYELTLNIKTARALDLAVPSTLLARADEVIE